MRINEIMAASELLQEGRAMRHCVASYERTCAQGTSAIYTLTLDSGKGSDRRLTIQLDVLSKRIVQARGRFNVSPLPVDELHLRNWATAAGLAIAHR